MNAEAMNGYVEVLAVLALILLCFTALIVFPAAGLWWLTKWLQRRQYRRSAVVMQVLLVGFGLFCFSVVYSFCVPFDSEIEHEFVQITGLPFPTSGEVIESKTSGLDLQGDYHLTARIKVSRQDYTRLWRNISADTSFRQLSPNSAATDSSSYQTFEKHSRNSSQYRSISFWTDGRTVTFHHSSN
ncbi:hypothetical protein [Hymenobacter canadensis]|uniref:DUF4190 domain-containing protein n=1 Tax=Hymenobacter canadensis TaxID=2999067 RepID=A0ABY7LTC5_9BACT|nr:hypothetical protein [Hymenobacter canadensis]WBA42143.1 hypothetical protein O3303_00985 [Hymenobacter canadensis]